MKNKYLILGTVLIGVLALFILNPKEKVKTRQEILQIEKEEKLQEGLKESKKELEKTIKANKAKIKNIEKKEKEEKKILEGEKKDILTEIDELKKSEKIDKLLDEIDEYKYSRELSIQTLEELKEELSKDEIKKINERLYGLYKSTDQFDKVEEIKRELNGGENISGKDYKEEL